MTNLIKDRGAALFKLEEISNKLLKEGSHLFCEATKGMKIIDAVNQSKQDFNSREFQPAIIFLRVVLAANRNYNTHVKPNISRIIKENSSLSSFESLNTIIKSKTQDQFYKFWDTRI